MIYNKPFKTIEEQIEILRSRNIIVNDEQFAHQVLLSSSYYSIINGYKHIFLKNSDPEIFKDGTEFETMYTLYLIETTLTNTLFKYIIHCERSLKTKIAYLIARKYEVSEQKYLNIKNYSNALNMRRSVLDSLNETINNAKDNTTTYYYRETHKYVPPWILVNDIPFGKIINWYSILIKEDKTEISNQMILFDNYIKDIEIKKELLKKSLNLLKDFRNKIAHGNKIFYSLLKTKLPKKAIGLICFDDIITEEQFDNGNGQNDIFSVIISIIILINDPYILTNFLEDLQYILDSYKTIKFVDIDIYTVLDIPKDYKEKLKILINKKGITNINTTIKKEIIFANPKTKIYHCPGQRYYNNISEKNIVYFETEQQAQDAGYRRAKR